MRRLVANFRAMGRMIRLGLTAGALAVVIAAAAHYSLEGAAEDAPRYRLAAVSRGPIASTISATGTLEAVITVDVGTQVSGMIRTLHADYNSAVEAGQVIARIDSAPFEAKVSEAEAELAVARASVAMQEASLDEIEAELGGARAALTAASDELDRKRELFARNVERQSAVDAAVAGRKQADARVKAAQARLARQKAQIELARAQVQQKAAAVRQRRLDLEYTYIRSPVAGVVISRNVDAGQTVAASLQAPVLFRIAQDLARMQVSVNVDEADIGLVRVGQKVSFKVDAFPDRNFEGRVQQIRKAGQEISNVVTYTVVAAAENVGDRLLPGMTAAVTIVVDERADALRLPSAALRLRLPQEGRAPPPDGDWAWVLDEAGRPQPVPLVAGISDAERIEVVRGGLAEGQKVIVGRPASPPPERRSWFRFGS